VRSRARPSVRARLTFIATAASIVTLAVGALLLYRDVSATLSSDLTAELRVHATDVRDEIQRGGPPSLSSGIETQVLDPNSSTVQPSGEEPLLDPTEISSATHQQTIVDREVDDRAQRVLALPATSRSGAMLVVAAAASTASITHVKQRLLVQLIAAGVALAAITTLAAWLLSGAALRPVRSMSRRARTLSSRDPEARLPLPPGRDEIAELGTTLNGMLERIAEARTRERAFIDDASHEMRAPLAVVRGELELALLEHDETGGPATTRRALASALDETDRLASLTDHLLVLARADAGILDTDRRPLDLGRLVRECANRLPSSSVRVEVDDPEIEFYGDAVAMEQLVTNLLMNAQRWATTTVHCELERRAGEIVLRVCDDGPGFPDDYLPHAFDRFRRGDPARRRAGTSTGLGLAIVAAIVRAHDGQIRLGNDSPLGGAWIEIELPTGAAPPDGRS
jgi:two-component system OmpR family sensor kinase